MQFDWLAQTKFISPRLRDDIVPRQRLRDALSSAIRNRALTLVSAPAGYGKTTLLTSLAAAFPKISIVWISLDQEDNDPAHFPAALIGGLQRTYPTFGTTAQSLLANFTNTANDARRVIGVLINEMLTQFGETWVMLDDLHFLSDPAIFSALDYWLERMPPQMCLIVATRHDPPLVPAELRVPHLRFSADEVHDVLNEKQGLALLVIALVGMAVARYLQAQHCARRYIRCLC